MMLYNLLINYYMILNFLDVIYYFLKKYLLLLIINIADAKDEHNCHLK